MGTVVGVYFPRTSFLYLGLQQGEKGLIPTQVHEGSWYGCGPATPLSPLLPTVQDMTSGPWEGKW